jgi:hypothetical protein
MVVGFEALDVARKVATAKVAQHYGVEATGWIQKGEHNQGHVDLTSVSCFELTQMYRRDNRLSRLLNSL